MDFGFLAGETSKTIYLRLRDSATGLAKTGLVFNSAGAVASYILPLAARAAITLATQTVTGAWSSGGFVEVDATNAKGIYRLDLPDAAIASGAFSIVTIQFTGVIEEAVEIELHTRKVNATQLSGDSGAADNAESFFDGTGYAGTNNVIPTVTTVTTTTNLTNLPAITAGWLTAAGIASDAFTAAKFAAASLNGKGDWNVGKTGYTLTATTGLGNQTADITGTITTVTTATNLTNLPTIPANWLTAAGTAADFGAEIATAIWTDTTASDFTTALSIGKSIMNGVTLGTGLTINAYTGNTVQTGDSFAIVNSGTHGNAAIKGYVDDIGTAGAGLTAIPWNAAWDAEVQSEVDDALIAQRLDELLNADSDIDGAAPPTVGSVFHELLTKTAGSFTYDQTTDSLEAVRDRGDAAWVTATGFSTHTAADVWTIGTRTLTAGTNIQLPSNGLANVTAWTVNVTGNLSGSVGSVTGAVGSIAAGGITSGSFAAGAIDAAAIAADAIGSSELAASAVTEIQTGLSTIAAADVWAYSSRTLTQTVQAASVQAVITSGRVTVYRSGNWSIAITGLGSLASYTRTIFTVKSNHHTQADSVAAVQIDSVTGLITINGAAAGTAANGSLTVDDATLGNITIVLKDTESDKLTEGIYYYDVRGIDASGNAQQKAAPQTLEIVHPVTRAIS